MKTYNERIKDLRIDHDKNQKEIAELCGVSDTTMQKYEYGQSEPKISTLITMAKFYKTSIDYIAGLTNERQPYPRA